MVRCGDLARPGAVLVFLTWGCAVGEGSDVGDPFGSFSGGDTSVTNGGMTSPADGGSGGADTDGATSQSSVGGNDGGSDDGSSADGGTCVPTDEVCDGVDNDCNGQVDDGNPGGGDPCDTGMPGACASGTSSCEGGAIVCTVDVPPAAESCDGLDNDCNGQVDDGSLGGGACSTGMPGVCSNGTETCSGGVLACQPDTPASAESCDGLDNDCDGAVDNGNPGGGGACSTGLPGICAAGSNQCSGGSLSCVQNQAAAGADICNNGLDDDCDGQIDDGCSTCVHDICLTGVALTNGCDPCVTQICAVDPFCCSNSWDGICVGEVGSVCGIVC